MEDSESDTTAMSGVKKLCTQAKRVSVEESMRPGHAHSSSVAFFSRSRSTLLSTFTCGSSIWSIEERAAFAKGCV